MKPVFQSFQPPSILIVVPTLNSFPLLPRLLSSMQQQSWLQWRVLFIDGPSGSEHREWLNHICVKEPRCSWQEQEPGEFGIFGAMNQGFALANPNDWLLFWGSDDWAASPSVLFQVACAMEELAIEAHFPDLIVCQGRYADEKTGLLGRRTIFCNSAFLSGNSFRRKLFLGATPPHQGTLFGPGSRYRIGRYAEGFRLSADLNYFLQISQSKDLQVQVLDLELVHMANGGISGQQTKLRFKEVLTAYRHAFGWLWWFPFLFRYARRLLSLIPLTR